MFNAFVANTSMPITPASASFQAVGLPPLLVEYGEGQDINSKASLHIPAFTAC